MKHTMKKLLCMALAIMLLVSAVPVFAAADNSVSVTIVYTDGVEETVSASYKVNPTTLAKLLDNGKIPGVSAGDFDHAWTNSTGTVTDPEAITLNSGDSVRLAVNFAKGNTGSGSEDNGSGSGSEGGDSGSCSPTPAPTPTYSVQINVKLNGTEQGWYTVTIKDSTTTVQNLINHKVNGGLIEGYTFNTAYVSNTNTYLDADGTVKSGDKVYIAFTKEAATVEPINIVVKVDGSDNVVWTGSKVPANGESAKVADLLSYCWNSDWDDVYTFDHAWSHDQQKNVAKTGSINAGDTVYIMLTKGSSSSGGSSSTTGKLSLTIRVNGTKKYDNDVKNFTKATVGDVIKNIYDSNWTSKYAFDKVEVNGVTYGRSDLEVMAGDEVDVYLTRKYSKDNSNKVYLHVYLNGDASTIAMTKDITGTYLMDDWSTDTTEILKYLKNNYYTAKDTSEAITIDGLYTNTNTNGAFPGNYYADNKVSRLDNIKDKLEDGYVHISVMLKNSKAKSSSTADSSNPKTGDTIFVPVMVMGLTASALAAAYVFGKKRFAR